MITNDERREVAALHGVCELLAELIEQIPEHTCEVIEYNNCGPHAEDCTIVFSCGHKTLGYIPNYCPSCGAKVIGGNYK